MHLGQYNFTMASPGMSDRPMEEEENEEGEEQRKEETGLDISYILNKQILHCYRGANTSCGINQIFMGQR